MNPRHLNEFKVKGKELLELVKAIFKEGNARRVIIKNADGETYLEIPVTVGVLGVLFAPILAAIGALAAAAAEFTVEVVRREDTPGKDREEADADGAE
jgi:hypothetical protein